MCIPLEKEEMLTLQLPQWSRADWLQNRGFKFAGPPAVCSKCNTSMPNLYKRHVAVYCENCLMQNELFTTVHRTVPAVEGS